MAFSAEPAGLLNGLPSQLAMFASLSRRLVVPARRLAPQRRPVRFTSTSASPPRAEYFVVVWDKLGADRARISNLKDVPASFHLLGEMLHRETLHVCGNCLACVSGSEGEVMELLQHTAYAKQGVWDLSTAQISALETVHTSDLGK